jgi:tetratricopeptide (TPR) repeat protein
MPRPLRVVALVAVAVAAIVALQIWVVRPYDCNIRVKRGTKRLLAALDLPPRSIRGAQLARINIAELEPCVARIPSNIGADMVLASGYRDIGQLQRASDLYALALNYDRRPELYFNLGQVQVDLGDKKSGIQNLIIACLYDPEYFDAISKEQIEVKDAVRAYLEANARRP